MADVAFDATLIGEDSPSEEVVVENLDAEPLVLGSAAATGSDAPAFTAVADDCDDAPLEPGEVCTVTVVFRPQRPGPHAATLDIPVDGDPEPLALDLSGEGLPWLRITPSVLDFGTLPFRTSSGPQAVTVENISGREISVLRARFAERISRFRIQSNGCSFGTSGVPLAAGAACRVTMYFTAGMRSGGTAEDRLIFNGFSSGAVSAWTEIGSVAVRGATQAPVPREPIAPIDTPDVSAQLGRRLRAALARLRSGGRARAALLRRGMVVRGIQPPVDGLFALVVRARRSNGSPARILAVRRRLPAPAAHRMAVRAGLTRAGRRLLRSGRPLVLDIELTMVARLDKDVSSADGVLRVPRAP